MGAGRHRGTVVAYSTDLYGWLEYWYVIRIA